ncbi:hypothetical protein [Sulfuricystis thermophila]|uniref:hypothetical protein n=1 Tax=Sulfuricystis thermophila TaxID=2496847 RepID=UPI00103624FF|nr:hypothetical protein [Sulfuricystis thermophila]
MVQEAKSVLAATLPPAAGWQPAVQSAPPVQANRADPSPRAAEVTDAPFSRQSAAYARLQASKDGLQNAALADRQRLAETETVRDLARQMRANLMAIVKNYPPFPPESEERRRYLELAIGIRKQMEALIVPPPLKGEAAPKAGPLMPQDLPQLTLQASDAEVAAAARALDAVGSSLTGFGEEIRARWAEPVAPAVARDLSAATAGQLAALPGGIGTTDRMRG